MRSAYAKRVLDLVIAGVALAVGALPMLIIAALIRITDGRPVLFTMRRPGLHGRPFLMYKFRTMTNAQDELGRLLPDEARITPIGKFLRSTSLDELPELLNVVKGDMSLVGPRPLRMEYLERYSPEQARRHDVKPGVTGLAQVEGRNALSWDERFSMDVWYVDHWSIVLDLKLLVRTIGVVLGRRGISHDGHATMPEFMGNGDGD